ncbi:MAG: hypothetical protein Sv326_1024 [Candidatus Fermentimicrarchaeum limneticum]|uniref:Uncharacterized protein n=1 Tax=Fermentimicrarchaeum limneticum TaxID=2795018 RepID=A0A7D6BCL2_FERL1|nr:MAG: hypothetical protein Sv326_1024 [Candidatus Fermentimicrarchaeum limneticum]
MKKASFQGKRGLKKAITTEGVIINLYITFLYVFVIIDDKATR